MAQDGSNTSPSTAAATQVSSLLQQWSELATDAALKHDTSRARLRASDLTATSVAVIMTIIAGAGNINAFSDILQDKKFLAFGALGILSGVLVAVQRYLGLPEKGEAHAQAAVEYQQLVADIKAQQEEATGTTSTPTRAFLAADEEAPLPVAIAIIKARLDAVEARRCAP